MEVISRFVLHIENFFLLSHFSQWIIQWTIAGIAIFSLVTLCMKNTDLSKSSVYLGVVVRLVLLVGLTVEMLHQVNVTEISAVYVERQPSLRQFLHFMFFGYIVVVGFYYIVTMNQLKRKGMFFTFDIAVLSLPVIQLLTSFFFYVARGEIYPSDVLAYLVILIGVSASLYLFFENFWRISWKKVVAFYGFTIGFVCWVFIMNRTGHMYDIMELTNLFTFLALLLTFHLIGKSSHLIIKRLKQPFIVLVTLLFIILSNPFLNLADVALTSAQSDIQLRYFESAELINVDEAKEIASKLTNDTEFTMNQPETQDFHNRYWFRSVNYSIDIDGVSGKVMNLHRKTGPIGDSLTEEEYIDRSFDYLEKTGRTLIERSQINTEAKQEGERYTIRLFPKMTDGSSYGEDWMQTEITWEKESVVQFHERLNLYKVDSLLGVQITEEGIEKTLKEWYGLIGKEVPPYVIDDVHNEYSYLPVRISISTKAGERVQIDGRTGDVIEFQLDLNEEIEFDGEEVEEMIVKQLDLHEQEWTRKKNTYFYEWSFNEPAIDQIFYVHRFSYSEVAPAFNYSRDIDYFNRPSVKVSVASRKEAFDVIKDELDYTPYATRYRLTQVVDDDGFVRLAWLIVIRPYQKAEHQLYLVDIETKEWVALYE
ncbi:hypothetical protein [Bacillus sp. FJAT-45037]|uniref:hypothetical protein n=1 Tax=Bacillus sp. FJAT-45037 TaxID=2011007 RepID=UPI0012FDD340|nr:hypothetical protein [Bacillus sp. FJAT-45037]